MALRLSFYDNASILLVKSLIQFFYLQHFLPDTSRTTDRKLSADNTWLQRKLSWCCCFWWMNRLCNAALMSLWRTHDVIHKSVKKHWTRSMRQLYLNSRFLVYPSAPLSELSGKIWTWIFRGRVLKLGDFDRKITVYTKVTGCAVSTTNQQNEPDQAWMCSHY